MMAENEALAEPKPRPIIRIGLFLVAHSLLVSLVSCVAGIFALLLLPVLAKNTYISENALMPGGFYYSHRIFTLGEWLVAKGVKNTFIWRIDYLDGSASAMLSNDDASEGHKLMNQILSLDSGTTGTGMEVREAIAKHILDLGGEVNFHRFQPLSTMFHPLHFFLGPDTGTIKENSSFSVYGINTVGIIRAPRGDGKEAIVMVTPYNSSRITTAEALSIGIAYSVFSLVSQATWLAKDIIWLAADSKHGEYSAVSAWLRDYNMLSFGDLKHYPETCGIYAHSVHNETQVDGDPISTGIRRAGTVAAAVVIKVADSAKQSGRDTLNIYAEASNGQMPNLDLINIVNYLAVHGQGFQVSIEKIWSLLGSWWLRSLGEFFEMVGKVAKSLNPQWKFGIPADDYVEGSATLASSLLNQAIGVPTGPHGPFRDFQIDAITMEISPRMDSSQRVIFLLRVGRLVEGVIRSVNNLLEKFHQSFFLYLLTSPSRFVSVGVYMIAFGLLIAPLPLVSAALFTDARTLNSSKHSVPSKSAPTGESFPTFTSWTWLNAAKTILSVHLWSIVVAMLPYVICQIPNSSPSFNLLTWIALSLLSLFLVRGASGALPLFSSAIRPERQHWALVKSVTIAAAFIGLSLMSVINFATAELGALLVVPMCLTAAPWRLAVKTHTVRGLFRTACNVLLLLVGFPPAALLAAKGSFDGFGDLWVMAESLWSWHSATYVYVCTVHLPCWVLCVHILLHRL